ncbi:MAG: hypothetical protein Q4D51_02200 [Eubacteriales bacterium]|nr:hypothetical protein [Eubacteriales bacterium]
MYFRMLKKDLKDKVGLNIVLFLFMIMASMFMSIGFVMLYTNLYGAKLTYKLCNTSDLFLVADREVDAVDKNRQKVEEILNDIKECDYYISREVVRLSANRVHFEGLDNKDSMQLQWQEYILTGMPNEMNVPYTMEDEPFYVENGHIAIAQHLAKLTGADIGDKVRITTQLGNIYEFEVSVIYKDPSSEQLDMLIISDADCDLLYSECPDKYDLYEVKLIEGLDDYKNVVINYGTRIIALFEDTRLFANATKVLFLCDDGIINMLVSVVMEIIAVFLIAMIFVTINFSLKSTIKREEKEIGVMKAMGVYSLSYRTLFAAKYIAFAIVGGVIGLPMALILSKKLINTFAYHIIFPSKASQIALSVAAVVICVLFIVGFTFLSLRRMNKISVMDAIHGENRGERFKKLPGLMLYKKKNINIPLFLAVSDILKRLKRYIYLMFAYICGISMILLVIQVSDTLCSVEYMQKYWQKGHMDFAMVPEPAYMEKLMNKAGGELEAYELINEELKENGIPASSQTMGIAEVNLIFNGTDCLYLMSSGDFNREDLVITEGHAPELYNEVAIPAFNGKRDNIHIGDIVTIEYNKYTEDHTSYNKVKEDFIVTGFFEGFGVNMPNVFMGSAFEGAVYNRTEYFSRNMDCADEDYDMYFEKMDSLFSDDEIRFIHKDGVMDYFMGSWVKMFNLMRIIVSVVIAIVLVLLTVMYQSIFIEEEVADVALLKSMGFGRFTIKLWHFLRIVILVAASVLAAHLLMGTVGRLLIQELARSILQVVEFKIILRWVANFVVVPFSVLGVVAVALLPALKPMDYIQIWRVKNE